MFALLSVWISGFVSLYLLFIYILSFPSLCLFSVSLVKSKLDPESLGIILLGPFLLEFFPDQVGVGMYRGGFSHPQYDKYLPSDMPPQITNDCQMYAKCCFGKSKVLMAKMFRSCLMCTCVHDEARVFTIV